jgi:hypothetical protein
MSPNHATSLGTGITRPKIRYFDLPWNSVRQLPRDSWPVEFGAVIFDQKNFTVVWEEIIVSHGLDSLIAMIRPCILSCQLSFERRLHQHREAASPRL